FTSTGGCRIKSEKPLLLQSDSNSGINDIELQGLGANSRIKLTSNSYESNVTSTSLDAHRFVSSSGGFFVNTLLFIDLNGALVNPSGHLNIDQINIKEEMTFERQINNKKTKILPSDLILIDYELTLPSGIPGSLTPTTYGALAANSLGEMIITGSINDVISATEPLDDDDQIVMNNATIPYTVKRAPVSVSSARFSGYIDGVLPSLLSNVVSLAAVQTETVFDVTPTGSILHKDTTDPQAIFFAQKTVTAITDIDLDPGLINSTFNTIYIYLDGRSDPILEADVIQKVSPPSEKLTHEIYLGNIDLQNSNSEIQRANAFSESAYTIADTSNTFLFNRARFNIEGCVFTNAGTDLELSHSAGVGIRMGANTVNDLDNPDVLTTALDAMTVTRYQYYNGTDWIISTGTNKFVDPTLWNSGGSLIGTNSAKYYASFIYFFYGSDSVRIQYPDQEFGSLAAANAAVTSIPGKVNIELSEAVLRGALVMKGDVMDLSLSSDATFTELDA
ncbi:MAG: hypothetical protein V3W20_01260, partial [Candidatus Neomarinimicrobiota bacterium]